MKEKIITALFTFLIGFSILVYSQTKSKSVVKTDSILKIVVPSTPSVDSANWYKGKFKPFKIGAHASYYGEQFNGRKTASGKIFNMNKLTAAHKKLPFGTIVRVTNEKNGKSVIVEITDRGPFVKGREIDLSKKAFYTISATSGAGYIKSTLEILQK